MDATAPPKILLVDDCPANRCLLEKLLVRDGFATVAAVNGAEAVELARRALPHVVIMDVMMPVMDGIEATRRLREDPRTASIPIIIVSARTDPEDLTAGLSAGADEYLFKPINAKEFRLRVRSMVRLRQAQLDLECAYGSLQRQTELLARLNEFSESALGGHTLEAGCRQIVETAAQLMNSNRVSLLIPGERPGELRFGYAVGMDESLWRTLRVPLDGPVAGEVFTCGREIVGGGAEPPVTEGPQPGGECPATAGRPEIQSAVSSAICDPRSAIPSASYASTFFASMPVTLDQLVEDGQGQVFEPLSSGDGPIGVLNITEKQGGGSYTAEELNTLRQFARTAALALNSVLTREKLDVTRDSIILSLARLSEYRHRETGKHLERVRDLSILLARQLSEDPRISERIDDQYMADLGRAAPLHDIGKVAIPDAILLKPGKLTASEYEAIKRHTVIGAQTLSSVMSSGHESGFLRMAMDIARHHHERYDGGGYPDGLAGESIPLSARIVAVADTYDAIRMRRDYKPPRPHTEAVSEIVGASGGQFDPLVAEAFEARQSDCEAIYTRHAEAERVEPPIALPVLTGR